MSSGDEFDAVALEMQDVGVGGEQASAVRHPFNDAESLELDDASTDRVLGSWHVDAEFPQAGGRFEATLASG